MLSAVLSGHAWRCMLSNDEEVTIDCCASSSDLHT